MKFITQYKQGNGRRLGHNLRPRTAYLYPCHTFSVAVSLCQFHRQSLFAHRQTKTSPFRYRSSARFVWQFLSIPTRHPIRILFLSKFLLTIIVFFLYIIVKFYERLCFNKKIMFMEEKEIMTVKQVAEYLQMDEHTVYKLARSGQIPSVKIAGQWRFKKDVIDKWNKLAIFRKGNTKHKVITEEKRQGKIIYG
jgi:excisionase family DNA binding protein